LTPDPTGSIFQVTRTTQLWHAEHFSLVTVFFHCLQHLHIYSTVLRFHYIPHSPQTYFECLLYTATKSDTDFGMDIIITRHPITLKHVQGMHLMKLYTHPGGKFHDSGTPLVLQVTNAGVRRPGYEAMLVYQDIQGLGKCIIYKSKLFSNEALSAWE